MGRHALLSIVALGGMACGPGVRDGVVDGGPPPDPDVVVIIDPSAPGDAPDRFDGAMPGGVAPLPVYPDTGVLIPPNLNTIEVHFRAGAGNDLFELTFTDPSLQLVVYLGCTPLADGCGWEPSQAIWDMLAAAGRGDQPMTWSLRGLDLDTNLVGTSEIRTLQFSGDDMGGGIYYWAAAAGTIMRYEFGRRGQTAERFLGAAEAGALQCVGCHALSRDGTMIAVGLEAPLPATVSTFTVETRTQLWRAPDMLFGPGGANFYTFSPDNQWLLSSEGNNLTLRAATTGASSQVVVPTATMPDWAPIGGKVVFSRPGMVFPGPGSPSVSRGSIVTVDSTTWSGDQVLVAGGAINNYYPSFSPDGAWIAYNQSAGAESFDAADARVMAVPATGGPPRALDRASPIGGDSWPKWAPFTHYYAGGNVMWLTFSSRRAYGLRGSGTSQIWMVGFDLNRAIQGVDPSFTAFWLPFQDPTSGNHIAQWVTDIVRQPCDDTMDCGVGEICEGGVCAPPVIE